MQRRTFKLLPAAGMDTLRRFRDDTRGVFAIIFAVMAVVLVAFSGAGVDFVRWRSMVSQAQQVADAAALAAAVSTAETDDRIREIVVAFAQSHGLSDAFEIEDARYDAQAKMVHVDITSTYPTVFVELVGVKTLPVAASAVAERATPGGLEVALVLDNTWSMSDADGTGVTKISALKSAAKQLVNTLFEEDGTNVRVALVPYANYVNVGTGNRSQPWLSVPADYDTTSPRTCETRTTRSQCTKGAPKTCTRVVDGVSESYDCTPSTCVNVTVAPYEYCTGGGTSRYRWYGCVRSRTSGTLRLSDLNPGTPYVGFLGTSAQCLNPIVPLTNALGTLTTNIDDMIVNRGSYRPLTYIPTGIVWGINTLSPTMPFTEGAEYDPANERPHKALVLMTDGDNTLRFQASDGQHVGLSSNTGTAATQKSQTDADALALCNYAKSQKIQVFTVSFGTLTAASQTLLTQCASSPANAFAAQNAAELEAAFDQIARDLKVIRLVR